MKKAIPAVVLELTANIFCEASSKIHDALAKTLTLPVKGGFVKVSIDGREVDLLLDSGFAEISVLDGDWYEREFGKNACEERRSACFFCPKENPCDYDGSEFTIKDVLRRQHDHPERIALWLTLTRRLQRYRFHIQGLSVFTLEQRSIEAVGSLRYSAALPSDRQFSP
ncbi:hypothetical protein FOZ60_006577 [Perkinsus olseni]|uniref:Uncharacterized protein n=1 Tax=Perkinsus olseni TaxID=32597 RepID=A0A7J6NPK1_PEROL|nr:hypothetical protein FOZ60_006577 [Perkinsus olseni]